MPVSESMMARRMGFSNMANHMLGMLGLSPYMGKKVVKQKSNSEQMS